jgi:hypothetical protein
MGPLRPKTTKNCGLRSEPVLETRVREYSDFINRGGIIQNGERTVVGLKGGELALITSLPEVLEKKCTRMNVGYKIGDKVLLRVSSDVIKIKSSFKSSSTLYPYCDNIFALIASLDSSR